MTDKRGILFCSDLTALGAKDFLTSFERLPLEDNYVKQGLPDTSEGISQAGTGEHGMLGRVQVNPQKCNKRVCYPQQTALIIIYQ